MWPIFNSLPARRETADLNEWTIAPSDPDWIFEVIPRSGADTVVGRGAAAPQNGDKVLRPYMHRIIFSNKKDSMHMVWHDHEYIHIHIFKMAGISSQYS